MGRGVTWVLRGLDFDRKDANKSFFVSICSFIVIAMEY